MEQSSWPPRWLTPVPAEAIKLGRHFEPVSLFAEAFGIITKDSVAGVTGTALDLRPLHVRLLEPMFAVEDGGSRSQLPLVGLPRQKG